MLGTILFVTPILAVIFFAMSLWQYVRVKNANKKGFSRQSKSLFFVKIISFIVALLLGTIALSTKRFR